MCKTGPKNKAKTAVRVVAASREARSARYSCGVLLLLPVIVFGIERGG